MIALLLIPNWPGLHPLIIHFPIALLLTAPVFILIGIFQKPQQGRPFHLAALILIVLGTASVFVAASTGKAAGRRADVTAEIKAVLQQHEELAETTEIAFSALTTIFAAILFAPGLLRRQPNRLLSTVLPLVFLVFYAAGMVLLVNAAEEGGRLVHDFGVRATISSAPAVQPSLPNGADPIRRRP